MDLADISAFIRSQTVVTSPPLVPELRLHLATEITPIWQASEARLNEINLPPPYWAFAWPGGQALSRLVLDRPEFVKSKRVLDFAAGAGLAAISSALSGARFTVAAETDQVAAVAISLNAQQNGVTLVVETNDIVGSSPQWDIVLAGDVCYERPMAARVTAWLRDLAGKGVTVLLGDPGRAYLPMDGLIEIARFEVPTSLELEDRAMRETLVYRMMP